MSQTTEQARIALAAAEESYLEELRRDSERNEGSGAQERRREDNQQSMQDKIAQCKRDLEDATKRELAAKG